MPTEASPAPSDGDKALPGGVHPRVREPQERGWFVSHGRLTGCAGGFEPAPSRHEGLEGTWQRGRDEGVSVGTACASSLPSRRVSVSVCLSVHPHVCV